MVSRETHTNNGNKSKHKNNSNQNINQLETKLNSLYLLIILSFIVQIITIVFFYNLILTKFPNESKPIISKNNVSNRFRRHVDKDKGDIFDNSVPQTPHVEFVPPDLYEEIREREKEQQNSTHNNPWVWLNAYSRIPVSIICSCTRGMKLIGCLRIVCIIQFIPTMPSNSVKTVIKPKISDSFSYYCIEP